MAPMKHRPLTFPKIAVTAQNDGIFEASGLLLYFGQARHDVHVIEFKADTGWAFEDMNYDKIEDCLWIAKSYIEFAWINGLFDQVEECYMV